MRDSVPDVVVLHGRTTPFEDFHFEVYDLADGTLVMKEPTYRVAAWLKAFGYKWILGSSGIWKREARRREPGTTAGTRPAREALLAIPTANPRAAMGANAMRRCRPRPGAGPAEMTAIPSPFAGPAARRFLPRECPAYGQGHLLAGNAEPVPAPDGET